MNRKTSLSLLTAALLAGAGADIAAAASSAAGITGIIVKYHSVSQLQLTQARIANGGRAPSSRPADFAARTQRVQQLSGDPLQFHHQMGTGAYVYQSGKALSVAEAQTLARKIQQDPAVEYAEPDFIMSPNYLPSSPLYAAKQWDMQASAAEPGAMNLPAAWDLSQGAGVIVAVLDTGYRPHADIKPNLLEPGYNFISDAKRARLPAVAQTNADGDPLLDSNGQPVQSARTNNGLDQGDYSDGGLCRAGNSSWHGTHVAGTIAAAAGDGNGLTGVAPKSAAAAAGAGPVRRRQLGHRRRHVVGGGRHRARRAGQRQCGAGAEHVAGRRPAVQPHLPRRHPAGQRPQRRGGGGRRQRDEERAQHQPGQLPRRDHRRLQRQIRRHRLLLQLRRDDHHHRAGRRPQQRRSRHLLHAEQRRHRAGCG